MITKLWKTFAKFTSNSDESSSSSVLAKHQRQLKQVLICILCIRGSNHFTLSCSRNPRNILFLKSKINFHQYTRTIQLLSPHRKIWLFKLRHLADLIDETCRIQLFFLHTRLMIRLSAPLLQILMSAWILAFAVRSASTWREGTSVNATTAIRWIRPPASARLLVS